MAPSNPLGGFPATAKDNHFKLNRAYPKTRAQIRQKTRSMFVSSSRLSGRAYAPTKKTTPPLRKRRYSVDVVTNDWNKKELTEWTLTFSGDAIMEGVTYANFSDVIDKSNEVNPPLPREPSLPLPDPRRRLDLSFPIWSPPDNSDTYLAGINVILSNEDFLLITNLQRDSWMRDSIVDTALELLSQEYQCAENDIEIASSMVSFLLSQVSRHGDNDNNNFASYNEERKRFQNKKFIFLPINDGYTQQQYQEDGGAAGTHWSFVVIDRIHKVASYVDSLYARSAKHQSVASDVMNGVQLLLDENYRSLVEPNAPEQYRHNLNKNDWGPCGPFVYAMIRTMVGHIRWLQDEGNERIVCVELPYDFRYSWARHFDSGEVREEIKDKIILAKQLQLRAELVARHDMVSLEGLDGDIIVDEELEETKDIRQREFVRQRDAASARAATATAHGHSIKDSEDELEAKNLPQQNDGAPQTHGRDLDAASDVTGTDPELSDFDTKSNGGQPNSNLLSDATINDEKVAEIEFPSTPSTPPAEHFEVTGELPSSKVQDYTQQVSRFEPITPSSSTDGDGPKDQDDEDDEDDENDEDYEDDEDDEGDEGDEGPLGRL